MKSEEDKFAEVKLTKKEQIIELMAVSTIALLLLACMAKVLFF